MAEAKMKKFMMALLTILTVGIFVSSGVAAVEKSVPNKMNEEKSLAQDKDIQSGETAVNKYYGEPVELKGRHIYFTSWKYVRQGEFLWKIDVNTKSDEGKKNVGQWLKGDSDQGAKFEPIDMPRGIRLAAQQAVKEPFKEGQREATIYENGKYKAWYVLPPDPNDEKNDKILPGHNNCLAYAESNDAVTWYYPKPGLFEYKGSRDNSIVFRGDVNGSTRGFHRGCVFVDPTSKEEHYKMLYLALITDQEWDAFEKKYPGEADTMARRPDLDGYRLVFAVFGAVSPDGIHWRTLPEPLMIQHADTANTCYYDVDLKKYVAYVRTWQVDERSSKQELPKDSTVWISVGRRSIGRAVSNDFRHFTKAEVVVSTDADMAPSHVWYTNAKTTLPDCSDNHVMFPWLWELERDGGSVWLLSSPDGWVWSKVPGGPIVSPSSPGQPDGLFVVCGGNLLEYPGDKWGILYHANPIPHKYPGRDINQRKGLFPGVPRAEGLATWPKGRLVVLQCDEEGEFATVAVIPPGKKIRINAVIPPTGYIKVGVRLFGSHDELAGRTVNDCDQMVGDSLAFPVTWKGNPNLNNDGRALSFKFKMKQAKLFGVEFID